jgi:hypothetical protein
MVGRLGLVEEINNYLDLLKRNVPYHDSDHILNMAYNVMTGGVRLQDIENRRCDEVFLNALGAERLPGSTTAGDFTRRFEDAAIEQLMDFVNRTREKVWAFRGGFEIALIDVDGTIAPTIGKCKGGMDISYTGIWGYHPLPDYMEWFRRKELHFVP